MKLAQVQTSGRDPSRIKGKPCGRVPSRSSTKSKSVLRVGKILVPVDFSDGCVNALHYAAAFARQFGAEIRLVHVIEPPFYPEFGYVHMAVKARKLDGWVRQQLRALVSHSPLAGLTEVTTVCRSGRARVEIIDEAKQWGADLMIISTHGFIGLAHALMGSTTEKVVRHASCPVLVVKELEHDFV